MEFEEKIRLNKFYFKKLKDVIWILKSSKNITNFFMDYFQFNLAWTLICGKEIKCGKIDFLRHNLKKKIFQIYKK